MVQAIITGSKTKTRRTNGLDKINECPDRYMINGFIDGIQHIEDLETLEELSVKCPYGQAGDVLWVRESFKKTKYTLNGFAYKANAHPEAPAKGWKPSIHLPKAACRIWLEIVSVKVERLQDISVKDSIAEGVDCSNLRTFPDYRDYHVDEGEPLHRKFTFLSPKLSFQSLWESVNSRESWNNNPWVWVVEFKQIKNPSK